MKQHSLPAAAVIALLLSGGPAGADSVVIEHVTLIDGTHAPQADMTVAVDGERIASVTPTVLAHGLKGRHIDARGKYLIPGLMDVHIHLRGGFDASFPDAGRVRTAQSAGGRGGSRELPVRGRHHGGRRRQPAGAHPARCAPMSVPAAYSRHASSLLAT